MQNQDYQEEKSHHHYIHWTVTIIIIIILLLLWWWRPWAQVEVQDTTALENDIEDLDSRLSVIAAKLKNFADIDHEHEQPVQQTAATPTLKETTTTSQLVYVTYKEGEGTYLSGKSFNVSVDDETIEISSENRLRISQDYIDELKKDIINDIEDNINNTYTSQTTNLSEFTNDAGYITTEIDPIYGASPAAGITNTDITNWNTAFGWGDHSTMGYLTSYSETDPTVLASVKDGVDYSEITNGANIYMNYQPNNTACADGAILEYDALNNRWDCGVDGFGAAGTTYLADGDGIELNIDTFSIELDGTTLVKGPNGLKISDTYDDNFLTTTTVFGGDVSGTYDAIEITDNSHNHDGTTISDLTTANFTDTGVLQWDNDAGYLTEIGALSDLTFTCGANQILKYDTVVAPGVWSCVNDEVGGSGGANQLTDLSDVNTADPTDRNILMADGTDWESVPESSLNITENDPIYGASPAAGITNTDITNWNTAFGWGDHSIQGYITDGNTNWDNSYGFITGVNYSEISNESGVYMDYQPNNIACGDGDVLKYDSATGWVCGDDNIGTGIANLQEAYVGGNTMAVSATEGDLQINTDGTGYYIQTDDTNKALLLGDGTEVTDILPGLDNTVTLGSTTFRFHDLYLQNSLHIGVDGNEVIIGYNTGDQALTIDTDVDIAGVATSTATIDEINAEGGSALTTEEYVNSPLYLYTGDGLTRLARMAGTASQWSWDDYASWNIYDPAHGAFLRFFDSTLFPSFDSQIFDFFSRGTRYTDTNCEENPMHEYGFSTQKHIDFDRNITEAGASADGVTYNSMDNGVGCVAQTGINDSSWFYKGAPFDDPLCGTKMCVIKH